ncbi:hypothetical protein Tco_1457359 [Tanacetum coccineum]|uniref:Uncharacterized protein n=1 Tax=Tanacetum coccineum TaxID=301880 RepID=A0ABQ5EUJ8_9ASTR
MGLWTGESVVGSSIKNVSVDYQKGTGTPPVGTEIHLGRNHCINRRNWMLIQLGTVAYRRNCFALALLLKFLNIFCNPNPSLFSRIESIHKITTSSTFHHNLPNDHSVFIWSQWTPKGFKMTDGRSLPVNKHKVNVEVANLVLADLYEGSIFLSANSIFAEGL